MKSLMTMRHIHYTTISFFSFPILQSVPYFAFLVISPKLQLTKVFHVCVFFMRIHEKIWMFHAVSGNTLSCQKHLCVSVIQGES